MTRNLRTVLCLSCLLFACLVLVPVLAQTEGQDASRDSLKGLKGVRVDVASPGSDAEKAGLERVQLQTDTELKLRTAGIPVLVGDEAFATPLDSYLEVRVTLVKGRFWTYAYFISIQLRQPAKVANGTTLFASTWQKGEVGNITSRRLPDLRRNVGDLTDMFTNDYLAANPK